MPDSPRGAASSLAGGDGFSISAGTGGVSATRPALSLGGASFRYRLNTNRSYATMINNETITAMRRRRCSTSYPLLTGTGS
jgi:hypothetical protein